MKKFKIFIALLFIWIILMMSANSLPSLSIHKMVLTLISLPLFVVLFFLALRLMFDFFLWILGTILALVIPRKKAKRSSIEEEYHHNNSFTEQVTLDHPDYVGILTKIDKKRIAEEYLAEQKRKKSHERKR